jgi:hypothetical protein
MAVSLKENNWVFITGNNAYLIYAIFVTKIRKKGQRPDPRTVNRTSAVPRKW